MFIAKWYNVELSLIPAELFTDYLKSKGVRFEKSACYNLYHFEIFIPDEKLFDSLNYYLSFLPD